MKTFLCFILFIVLCSFAPAEAEPFKFTWQLAIVLLAGIYEVVVRVIPTIANYSWIAKIIDILKWLSDFLNRKKK
jgi:hypothetical protein